MVAETVNLTKYFDRHRIVETLDVTIERGSVYGLLGPNGAAKTTLLKLLVGLLRPTEGEVKLFGERWHRKQLGRVGALIEAPALYGHLTGRENLEVHRRLLGLPEKRIDEVLRMVDLLDAAKKRVSAYSLGMKQRLGIAVALIGDPEFLILDEPTNGLDPPGIRGMRDLIRSFGERGVTVLVSSHILSEVAQVVDKVGIVSAGEFRYQGTIGDLMGQGRAHRELRTDHNEAALKVAREHFPGSTLEDGTLLVPTVESETAGLLARLDRSGVRVEGMNYPLPPGTPTVQPTTRWGALHRKVCAGTQEAPFSSVRTEFRPIMEHLRAPNTR